MQAPPPLIAANWKMNGTLALAETLGREAALLSARLKGKAEIVLCPPAPLLGIVAQKLAGSPAKLGAQDCHAQSAGAFTGDVSAAMLKEAGCDYVILGHSERREGHGESGELIGRKMVRAFELGLKVILCVGETLAARESGQAEAVVAEQLRQSLPANVPASALSVAYEPVWAIGSGRAPGAEDIRRMHSHIAMCLQERYGWMPRQVRILYGGSVKAANAAEILQTPGVGGVLVGGASLDAAEFSAIAQSVHSAAVAV